MYLKIINLPTLPRHPTPELPFLQPSTLSHLAPARAPLSAVPRAALPGCRAFSTRCVHVLLLRT